MTNQTETNHKVHSVILSAEIGKHGEVIKGDERDFTVKRESTGKYLVTVNLNNENISNKNIDIEIIKAQVTTTTHGEEFKGTAELESRANSTFMVLGKKLVTGEPIDVSFTFTAYIDVAELAPDNSESYTQNIIDATPRSVSTPKEKDETIELVVKSKRKTGKQAIFTVGADGIQMIHGGKGIRINDAGVQINHGEAWVPLVQLLRP